MTALDRAINRCIAPRKPVGPQRFLADIPVPYVPFGGAATPEALSETLDTLYSTTWQLMRDEVVDNIFTATPFWYWLTSRGRIREESGGRWIGAQAMYVKNATARSFAPGGTLSLVNQEMMTTLKYDWRYLGVNITRLINEETENRSQAQIINLFGAKTKHAELSLVDLLETQAWGDGSGNGGLNLLGVQSIVKNDPTTNPASPPGNIGGIDAATNSWWRNQTRTYSVVGITLNDNPLAFNLRTLYNNCSQGNDHPTLAGTEQRIYELYEAGLVPTLRTLDNEFGDLGFEALRYKGLALTWSPSAPANETRMFNERYLEYVVEQSMHFRMTDWKEIPDQPFDRVAQIVEKGNLICTNRRMQGVLISVP